MNKSLKNELRDILSGKNEIRFGTIIQTIAGYLKNGEKTSATIENEKYFKEQEKERLEKFISENKLWVNNVDFSQYVSEGAEQKVYLKDSEHVIKLNDAIYYSSWKDYFYNLLLHNFFFSDTAYDLVGFTKNEGILYAIVKQNYVLITSNTDLSKVKSFLTLNGFENNRNNDYYNGELGIIL
ncbi:putative polyvalent protein kinase domain-containing protein [Flavobacterium agrisoli]|uniref:putative polyvalent protein kinase domain-containing protein n=1 Tax=Flavobacterium agrisoli TaxID=2793066 RepID=UPI001F439660|nr:hypothetical protein [Flavobacterium agrisoli]